MSNNKKKKYEEVSFEFWIFLKNKMYFFVYDSEF